MSVGLDRLHLDSVCLDPDPDGKKPESGCHHPGWFIRSRRAGVISRRAGVIILGVIYYTLCIWCSLYLSLSLSLSLSVSLSLALSLSL